MSERLLAVAAPDHPLHRLQRELSFDDLRGHRHLIIRDSGTRRNASGAWEVTEQRWTVSHKATSIRALRMGLGFAWMAEGMIRDELAAGELAPLPLAHGGERWGTLYLVYPDPETAGPGALRLGELLQGAAATGTA